MKNHNSNTTFVIPAKNLRVKTEKALDVKSASVSKVFRNVIGTLKIETRISDFIEKVAKEAVNTVVKHPDVKAYMKSDNYDKKDIEDELREYYVAEAIKKYMNTSW